MSIIPYAFQYIDTITILFFIENRLHNANMQGTFGPNPLLRGDPVVGRYGWLMNAKATGLF